MADSNVKGWVVCEADGTPVAIKERGFVYLTRREGLDARGWLRNRGFDTKKKMKVVRAMVIVDG